jgi:AraC-like DNA-binding protein
MIRKVLRTLQHWPGRARRRAGASSWIGPLLAHLESPGPFNAEAFAAESGMALSTLRRRFRQITGTPLHARALQARIARARRLLGESEMPIKAIARQLGYQYVYFFSREFYQQTGHRPAAFRRARQGDETDVRTS